MKDTYQDVQLVTVTADNVEETGIFCIKDKKSPGYQAKIDWFKSSFNQGLTIKIVQDQQGKQIGFIEYLPAEIAWRPILANDYLFIQCIAVFVKEARENGIAAKLIQACEQDALSQGKAGICAMGSDGPWMANHKVYTKNNFMVCDKLDRFELFVKPFNLDDYTLPKFRNWRAERKNYSGYHLIYSNQCPWHQKSVTDLQMAAKNMGIDLKIILLKTPEDAQIAPSGFGTFSLLKDGKILADHYISKTRFENIIRNENKGK